MFFTIHDSTTLNRQRADVGTQYRSAIFNPSPEQKADAETASAQITAKKKWDKPIVTKLSPFSKFFQAEDYHQEYFSRHPKQGYCQFVVAPKSD